ncbi:MAG: GntR family transcriptional regulator [Lachnospiraceae bacterium]
METSLKVEKVLGQKVIKPKSLAMMAVDIIRPKIINGEIPMGELLKEPEFSETLKVSRSCIREAFMILESEGLIVRNANKSARVVTFTQKDITDLYQLRTALETSCMERCFKEKLLDLDLLNELSDEIGRSYNEAPEDTFIWLTNDYKFHSVFVESCSNSRISEIYKNLMYQVEMLVCYCAKLEQACFVPMYDGARHDILIHYICNQEYDKAITYLKNHLSGTPRVMIEVLRRHNK